MAKTTDVGQLFTFMGLVSAMAADFVFHSRSLAGAPVFTDPKMDFGDVMQMAIALGAGIMGIFMGNKEFEDLSIGALSIQVYMKVICAKYPWLPRYIIARGGTI